MLQDLVGFLQRRGRHDDGPDRRSIRAQQFPDRVLAFHYEGLLGIPDLLVLDQFSDQGRLGSREIRNSVGAWLGHRSVEPVTGDLGSWALSFVR